MSLRKTIIQKLGEGKDVKTIVNELLTEDPQRDKKKIRTYVYVVRRSINKIKETTQGQTKEITNTIQSETKEEKEKGGFLK